MREQGIYKITNTITNQYYVGSSIELDVRRKTHFRYLKKNKHWSIYLQRSWNKYGEHNFIFSVVEKCDGMSLVEIRKIEQGYLDYVKENRSVSLNVSFVATGGDPDLAGKAARFGKDHHHHNPKIYRFKNVLSGELYEGIISEFYRKYKLDSGRSRLLSNGKAKSYNGWVRYESNYIPKPLGKNSRSMIEYKFINTITNETSISTPFEFYTKYKLNANNVNKMVKFRDREHLGWKCLDIS